MALALALVETLTMTLAAPVASAMPLSTWTTYAHDLGHSGYNSTARAIGVTNAAGLTLASTSHAGGAIVSQPVTSGTVAYWGSWDGYERATNASGTTIWATYLGTIATSCASVAGPYGRMASETTLGISGTATLATIGSTPMLIVGGGNRYLYALNPTTGAIIWQTLIDSDANAYLWSSPVVYNGNVYIGTASIGDCPLVASQFSEVNASNGQILHTFSTVPTGCLGAGVWSTASVDVTAGTLYFTTGNPGSCSTTEPYAESLVELNVADLSFVHAWQVPASQATIDGDFGATPTLFSATINGALHQLVGAANKNGIFYAWDRANISAGPVWQDQVAVGGECPQCGNGSIAPAAWDGTQLYVAGGSTTINGTSCQGSTRGLNPATGAYVWQHCMSNGPVLGAVTAAPGIVVADEGNGIVVMAAANGVTLFTFTNSDGQLFYAGPSVSDQPLYVGTSFAHEQPSNGRLYVGSLDGTLFAFRP